MLNPVRAGMVQRVDGWPWSSYCSTVGKCEPQDWLDAEWIIKQFGTNLVTARHAYRRFVLAGVGIASPWESLRGQVYLGEDKFLALMEKLAAAQYIQGIPATQLQPTRPDAIVVLSAVASAFGATPAQIQNRSHQRAFQVWVYLLRRVVNLSLREVSDKAGVSPSRISQIQATIETRPPDALLAELMSRYKIKA